MADSSERNPPAQKRKRGPYKRYVYHGSVAPIPTSTKHDWNVKRQASISEKSSLLTHRSTEEQYDEETSSADEIAPLGIGNDKDIEPLHFDVANSEKIEGGNIVLDSDEENTSNNDGAPSDFGDKLQEASDTTEKYDKDFLVKALLILATKLRHNLTYAAAQDVVQLISVLGNLPITQATKYYWKKLVDDFSTWMAVHYICDKCGDYIGVKTSEVLRCMSCNNLVDMNENVGSNAFLYISLSDQLKEIFELTKIHETTQTPRRKQRACAIDDISDGTLYKMKISDGMISINFSVDGVPVFDSSNYSIYPLLCTINELRPDQRKDHVLLCGLWFGEGKPKKMNEYLKPFVAEAQLLYNEGFSYKYKGTTYMKKCCVLVGVCDSVARPMLRNSVQYNGAYGCGFCLHPGETVHKGKGHVRVYPIDSDKNVFGEGLRTHEQSLKHAEVGEKGFRSRSVLCDVPEFDIVSSLAVDWMHSVALGVCRQFAKLWFDSAYHKEQFYFGHLIKDVDMLLLSYCPTIEVSRTPRKMSDRSHWKAHEWVIFLLFYSLLTLLVLFPRKYVVHWALLVDGIQILLKTSIMKSEIVYAHRSLLEFIIGVQQLYGKEYVSFNIHLLAHLSQSVENWGPLWTHSAFIYENANQALLSYVKSSNGVAKQICDTFRAKCVVDRLTYICSEVMTHDQKTYLDQLRMKQVKPKTTLIVDNTHMLGALNVHTHLTREHHLAFERANVNINDETVITSYKRAIIHSEVIQSTAYTLVEKRCNYYVRLINDEIFEIHLFYVLTSNMVSCYALGKYFHKKKSRWIKDRRLEHMIVFEKRIDDLAVISTSMIKEKVIMLYSESLKIWIACVHPNHCELLT